MPLNGFSRLTSPSVLSLSLSSSAQMLYANKLTHIACTVSSAEVGWDLSHSARQLGRTIDSKMGASDLKNILLILETWGPFKTVCRPPHSVRVHLWTLWLWCICIQTRVVLKACNVTVNRFSLSAISIEEKKLNFECHKYNTNIFAIRNVTWHMYNNI